MLAAEKGNFGILKIFVNAGADVNITLIKAVESNSDVCIVNLVDAGADANVMNSIGDMVLMRAVVYI